jgi:transcriptional regulator with XRE-family HTH domain
MPQKPQFKLPPRSQPQSIGVRIARLRKAHGLTQIELAAQLGITQSLLSSYERDRLKLSAEMTVHFAQALKVSSDELLGMKAAKATGLEHLSLKLTRRLKGIEALPVQEQRALLKTIDKYLRDAKR